MSATYDAIVIGGGHNGLVTAAYLAKGGEKEGKNKLKVLVLERYHKVGGAAMSEEIYPGFTYSTCSYVCSLLRPEIFRFLIRCSGETPIRAAARRALILDTLDLRPKLPNIPHPVLMIGGDRDAIVPRWCEADVEKGLPNVRRVEFTPCGHYPQYTMPGPMAEEMGRFLDGSP